MKKLDRHEWRLLAALYLTACLIFGSWLGWRNVGKVAEARRLAHVAGVN